MEAREPAGRLLCDNYYYLAMIDYNPRLLVFAEGILSVGMVLEVGFKSAGMPIKLFMTRSSRSTDFFRTSTDEIAVLLHCCDY